MEIQDNNQPTSTEVSQDSSPEVTTPAPEVQAPAPAKSEPSGLGKLKEIAAKGAEAPAIVAPAYTPNYKWKALDKEEEFDEFLRPVIKDPDIEKKVRALYEKAGGFDFVKSQRDKFKDESSSYKTKHESLTKGLDHLSGMMNKKDFHGFFSALKIPEQDILQYALERVNYKELPPEQRQQMDQQYEERQKLSYYERANEELLAMHQQQQVQQRTSELDGYLGKPDVSSVAQDFDARAGRPGAFRDEVIRRGQYYASIPNGRDISVEQAAQEVLMLVGRNQAQQGQTPQVSAQQVEAQNQKPVIPNIKGRGTSPAKKVVHSLADLRKKAKELNAQE